MSGSGTGALFFSRTWNFLERYLPMQAGRSRRTIESYRDALTVFRRWLRDERGKAISDFTFGDCTRNLVLSFLEWMRASGLSAGTCNQRLAALRSHLAYAADDDVAIQSVSLAVSRIPRVKGPQRVKEILKADDLRAIMSVPDPGTRKGVRDRTMMALLHDSAMRLSELLALRVGDVWLDDEPRVFVTGKGRKERFIAITERAVDHLRVHIACNHGEGASSDDPLFYTMHGGRRCRMSDSNLQRILQHCADVARDSHPGIPSKVYPHMLRRSRATGLWRDGVEVELISNILGHESVDTTLVYAKQSLDQIRTAMERGTAATDGEKPEWVGAEDELAKRCGIR